MFHFPYFTHINACSHRLDVFTNSSTNINVDFCTFWPDCACDAKANVLNQQSSAHPHARAVSHTLVSGLVDNIMGAYMIY